MPGRRFHPVNKNPRETHMRTFKGAATGILLCGLLLSTSGCFRVSRDTTVLRDAVLDNSSADWDQKVELGAGRLTFALAHIGSRWVDMPEEAREIFGSVSGGEVSVFESKGKRHREDRAKILEIADRKMSGRGWERMVGVSQEENFVAVYVPKEQTSTRNVRVCVLVLNERNLVCASARTDLKPLLKLAMEKTDENFPRSKPVDQVL